jgi:hypothetical protein
MYTTFSIGTSCMVKNNELLLPHLGPSAPTLLHTCRARRRVTSSSTSVQERLASANTLAGNGKQCEPGFPDAEPFYTYTAPPRIFFRLTILVTTNFGVLPVRSLTMKVRTRKLGVIDYEILDMAFWIVVCRVHLRLE